MTAILAKSRGRVLSENTEEDHHSHALRGKTLNTEPMQFSQKLMRTTCLSIQHKLNQCLCAGCCYVTIPKYHVFNLHRLSWRELPIFFPKKYFLKQMDGSSLCLWQLPDWTVFAGLRNQRPYPCCCTLLTSATLQKGGICITVGLHLFWRSFSSR